jgi:hypothetical protein
MHVPVMTAPKEGCGTGPAPDVDMAGIMCTTYQSMYAVKITPK